MPKKHPNPDDVAFSVQLRLTPLEKEWLTIIAMRKGSSLAHSNNLRRDEGISR